MTPLTEKSGVGLRSKQPKWLKVHSLSKEQGEEKTARSKTHDSG